MKHDLELVAIVFGFKVWDHYLYGFHFEMFNNHNSLKYLFDQKELNMRHRKCMEHLKDYNFRMKYNQRKENKVEEVLS